MAGNIKVNPDAATQVATQFGQKSGELTSIISQLNAQVQQNIGDGKPAWEGTQARQFEADWNGEFKPALERLVQALDGARELLTKTVAAYEALDRR